MFIFFHSKNKKGKSFKEICQEKEIQLGKDHGVDTSVYENKRLSPTIMQITREYLELGVSPNAAGFLIEKLLSNQISENEFESYLENSVYIVDIEFLKERFSVRTLPVEKKRNYSYPASFYGAVFGDMVGSQFEKIDKVKKINSCYDCLDSLNYSDDTILSIASSKAMKQKIIYSSNPLSLEDYCIGSSYPYESNPFACEYMRYAEKYPECGFGAGFFEWVKTKTQSPYGSIGNGAAMRVSPLIDFFDSEDDIIEYAAASAACTHNHIEGVKGAVVVAIAGWMGKSGYMKNQIFEYIKKYYPDSLTKRYIRNHLELTEFTMEELKSKIGPTTCPFSVPAAAICINESTSFVSAMNNVLSLQGDIDTLAAITGSIAGTLYGVPDEFRELVDLQLEKIDEII